MFSKFKVALIYITHLMPSKIGFISGLITRELIS